MKICALLTSQFVFLSPVIQLSWTIPKPLRTPVTSSVPSGPAANVCGGVAVESGCVIDGRARGVGAVAGVAAGAAAGVCCGVAAAASCANNRGSSALDEV